MNYEIVLEEFKNFTQKFDIKNPDILMKINHSYYVADLASKLAKRLELDEEKRVLLKVIGLLHDLGRFIQYENTGVYSDVNSMMDHANLGINYLFLDSHIKDFKIPEKYYEIIEKVIKNHNKLKIDENLKEEELFLVRFIRDVDKIDILRQEAAREDLIYDTEISNKVKKDFYNHVLINKKDIKSTSEAIVSELAYVFDINFKESYELLNESDNLELYLSVIMVDKQECITEFDLIKKEVRTYLENKIK